MAEFGDGEGLGGGAGTVAGAGDDQVVIRDFDLFAVEEGVAYGNDFFESNDEAFFIGDFLAGSNDDGFVHWAFTNKSSRTKMLPNAE